MQVQSLKGSKMTTKIKRLILPAAILGGAFLAYTLINANPPEARRFGGAPQTKMLVEAQTLQSQPFQIDITSYGVVKPRTQSELVAQVSGQISYVSPNLRDGGFFEKGELLLSIDDRDYQAEVKIAEASLLSAKQALLEEEARSEQALADWKRLGKGGEPNALVLRKPQLEAQKANVLSAQAKLDKAKLALERTKISAPFAGRVLNKKVDLGQVIGNNTQIASIYASDVVEVRLPINNRDLAFVSLPELYRTGQTNNQFNKVELSSDLIGKQQWQGQLVRTEGAIDNSTQQLYVVAQINDPYATPNSDQLPVKIGQYVNARISGNQIDNAIVVPNQAIYQGSFVYVLDTENRLNRREINIAWQNNQHALIKSGLVAGDRLVTTPLGQVSSGTQVQVVGEQVAEKPTKKRDIASIPPERLAKLEAVAKKRGISVEQLLAERAKKQEGNQ